MEIRWQCYAGIYGTSAVQLSPETGLGEGGETRPRDLQIDQINIVTNATTPPAGFWSASGTCGRFEVIIRRLT